MIEFSARQLFQQVQQPGLHGIDLIARFQSRNAVSAATGAAASLAEMKPI
jgi:hypothetical protein